MKKNYLYLFVLHLVSLYNYGQCGNTIAPETPILVTVIEQCTATPIAPKAVDLCDGFVIGIPNVSFPITAQGTTVITWTFTDSDGNSTTANQNVIVDDTVAPITPTLANVNVGQCSGTPTAPTTTGASARAIT